VKAGLSGRRTRYSPGADSNRRLKSGSGAPPAGMRVFAIPKSSAGLVSGLVAVSRYFYRFLA
jgi:hypothetical protein